MIDCSSTNHYYSCVAFQCSRRIGFQICYIQLRHILQNDTNFESFLHTTKAVTTSSLEGLIAGVTQF